MYNFWGAVPGRPVIFNCGTPTERVSECLDYIPAGIYMLKVNNRNTGARYEICSKLTINTPE